MKVITKFLSLILAALMVFSLCACGSKSENSSNNNYNSYVSTKITTSSAAISAVKNYMKGSFLSIDQQIAKELNFNKFYSPDFGTETAKQNNTGDWEVTLKGKMSGYVDEYHDDFESYKFELTAKVSEYGTVSNIRVKKAY